MNFLGENSLFGRIFGFLGQMIALNFLWMICCIPVITAGASTTALFYCMLKLHKEGDVRTFRDFFKSFRQNLVQSTVIWTIMIAAAVFLYAEREVIKAMPGASSDVFTYVLGALCIPLLLIALYIFPTIAAFENKLKILITNAFYFAVKHIGYALAVAVITILPMFMTLVDARLFPIYLFVWLCCGFSLTAYADAWFMWKLFKPCFPEEETKESEAAKEQEGSL